jgi:hypothetical protein
LKHTIQCGKNDLQEAFPPLRFWEALGNLIRHPQQILFLWNWKSAWLSIILRGPIFAGAALQRGLSATLSALLTECAFCAVSAGFYGALVQILRNAEPAWLSVLFLTAVVPGLFQVLEFLLHWLHGTPHLRLAEIASIVVSAVSALFNWYAMRHGALLVGGEGGSFGSDLRRLPGLILNFVTALPRLLPRRSRSRSSKLCCAATSGES